MGTLPHFQYTFQLGWIYSEIMERIKELGEHEAYKLFIIWDQLCTSSEIHEADDGKAWDLAAAVW
jgi:hypothetical protein